MTLTAILALAAVTVASLTALVLVSRMLLAELRDHEHGASMERAALLDRIQAPDLALTRLHAAGAPDDGNAPRPVEWEEETPALDPDLHLTRLLDQDR